MRSLEDDRPWITGVALGLLLLVAAAWIVWASWARISVTELSIDARLEVSDSVFPLEAAVAGRLERIEVAVGDRVEAGQTLVVFDASSLEAEMQQERARLQTRNAELGTARDRLKISEAGVPEAERGRTQALRAAEERSLATEIEAEQSRVESERSEELFRSGMLSEADFQASLSASQRTAAEAREAIATLAEMRSKLSGSALEDEGGLVVARGEVERLEGEIATLQASLDRLQLQIDRFSLTAPRDARVAELESLRPGSVLAQGDHIGTLVSAGEIRVTAELDPATAAGRVRPGQRAWVRLRGFPRTQYGGLKARVLTIEEEPRDGVLRSELALLPDEGSPVPRQHGLPASVEIEVEVDSPGALLLRTLGQSLGRSSP